MGAGGLKKIDYYNVSWIKYTKTKVKSLTKWSQKRLQIQLIYLEWEKKCRKIGDSRNAQ